MDGDLFNSFAQGFWSIWQGFERAGALANFVTIMVSLISIAAGLRLYAHKLRRDKDGQISLLTEDRNRRDEIIDDLGRDLKDSNRRCAELRARLPEEALKEADKERQANNFNSDRALQEWLEREGEQVSQLLYCRSEWATERAVGDLRSAGLVAAEAYAIAAVALCPDNQDALELLGDLAIYKREEGHSLPTIKAALTEMIAHAVDLFNPNLVEEADEAETEAMRRMERGYYQAAFPVAERALALRLLTVGQTAVPTLRSPASEGQNSSLTRTL